MPQMRICVARQPSLETSDLLGSGFEARQMFCRIVLACLMIGDHCEPLTERAG